MCFKVWLKCKSFITELSGFSFFWMTDKLNGNFPWASIEIINIINTLHVSSRWSSFLDIHFFFSCIITLLIYNSPFNSIKLLKKEMHIIIFWMGVLWTYRKNGTEGKVVIEDRCMLEKKVHTKLRKTRRKHGRFEWKQI